MRHWRWRRIASGAMAVCGLAIAGCASTERYMEWLPLANPETVCSGQADCVLYSTHRGIPACTLVTKSRAVSYSRFGELVRECVNL